MTATIVPFIHHSAPAVAPADCDQELTVTTEGPYVRLSITTPDGSVTRALLDPENAQILAQWLNIKAIMARVNEGKNK